MKKEILQGMSTINWSEVVSEAEIEGMHLSKETLKIAQFFFNMGHTAGQEAMFDVIKDMYMNDTETLVETFEDQ